MNKQEAEQQADELIGMNFSIPEDVTAAMQMKLTRELERQLEVRKRSGKIFWYGAAAVVIINVLALSVHFSGSSEVPSRSAESVGSVQEVADYYYSDKLNSY